MDDPASFGRLLRERRKTSDLTQEQLAEQVHCSVETIKKIEAGKLRPSKHLAELLATQFALPPIDHATFIKAARAEALGSHLPNPPSQPTNVAAAIQNAPQGGVVLPTGTITFLFTDIEGSTQLWEQHPQAMQHVLARHDTILHETITAHTGVIIKSTGDGVLAAFARPPDALIAALAAQRSLQAEDWGGPGPLRVRMAIHTGVAKERAGDYFGPPVNRAARLLAAGHGGQILLSLATAELVRDHLPPNVALHDLGTHRLKDLTRPEHIFQLVAPDLPADFPLLQTLDARRTNLPIQPTPLIGREQEVARVCALVRRPDVRLVTLSGPGGIGKTRLGLQVAAEMLDDFADGIYFINLAPLSDPVLVGPTIAQTLGVTETGGQPLVEDLKTFLRDKQTLLVLDNFEQVLDAAPLVSQLLAAAPGLKTLSTSRIVLKVRGEKEFPVPPLALPDPLRLPPLEILSQYAAVELFIQRAVDVKSNFQLTNANAPAVAEICARLDGLPLAIELVAARLKLLSPETLIQRLRKPLQLLTGGPRDLPIRQQTLRATIDWSYHLLDADEQALFQRLAVFVGGWTLEAAKSVCNSQGDLSLQLLDVMTALVDKSLLQQAEDAGGESRLTMLETIREYAWERLEASGEAEVVRQEHAAYYLALVEVAEPELERAEQIVWLQRLALEHDNLRATFAWMCATPGTVEMSLRFTGALYGFWERRRYLSEARAWLEAALARPGGSPAARTKALFSLAQVADHLQEYAWAMTLYSESLTIFQELEDRIGVARALLNQGRVLYLQGDYERADRLVQQSLTRFQELGDRAGVSMALMSLGDLALLQGDLERARACFEEGKIISQELGLTGRAAGATINLGRTAHAAGDERQASRLMAEGLALFQAVGDQSYAGGLLLNLARSAHRQGHEQHTALLYRESLKLLRHVGTRVEISECLAGLAGTALSEGELQRAGRLTGAADALRVMMNAPRTPVLSTEYAGDLVAGRSQSGAWETAWAEGHAMTVEQAIAYALSEAE